MKKYEQKDYYCDSETKKDDEVLDEIFYSDAVEEADTELKDNNVMYFDNLTIPGVKNDCYWNDRIATGWWSTW